MNDREKLIDLLHTGVCDYDCSNCEYAYSDDVCINHLEELAADYLISNGVTIQKHGQWITACDGTHFCSECGCDAQYIWDDIDRFFINSADDVPDRIRDYCPNCGTKMDLEE